MNSKPYVVSEDIQGLLSQWANEKGFILPSNEYFIAWRRGMRDALEDIFGKGSVDMISEGMLQDGMRTLAEDSGMTPVSIDQAYFPSSMMIHINRAVRPNLDDDGVTSRYDFPPLVEQVDALYQQGLREVVLVDDVIFTGSCMRMVIDLLEKRGIHVPRVIAGVVVGDGRNTLRDRDIDVRWVRFYSQVIDEICERDFVPGVPYCGRAIARMGSDMGVPYLLPFGDPVSWASIPKTKAIDFSQHCVRDAIDLWREIERVSGKIIRCCDVPRSLFDMPNDATRFVDYLEKCRHTLIVLERLARRGY